MAHYVLNDLEKQWVSPIKNEVCAFARIRHGGEIEGVLSVRVDDVLLAGSPVFLREDESIIRTFRASETETPKPGKHAILLGLRHAIDLQRAISISRNRYISGWRRYIQRNI